MVAKRILCSERLRRVPKRFSWIDHRLVRDNHIRGKSHSSLALYLFLVTVGDADGISYYSDKTICDYLHLTGGTLPRSRSELSAAGLIVYSRPLYQVLSLDESMGYYKPPIPEKTSIRKKSDLDSLGEILQQAMGGAQ